MSQVLPVDSCRLVARQDGAGRRLARVGDRHAGGKEHEAKEGRNESTIRVHGTHWVGLSNLCSYG